MPLDWIRFLELAGLGLIASTWGALIGAGGGFIIVPFLLFFDRSLSPAVVTAVSLIAVFSNGVSGAIAYARLRRIDYRTGLVFLVATLPGGVVGARLVNHIDRGPFQVVFGILLVIVSLYIFARPRRPAQARVASSGSPRHLVDSRGTVYEYAVRLGPGAGITFIIGFLASMLGVGGGIFGVPVFVYLLGIPILVATATSQFMLIGTSGVANITNILEGDIHGLWATALALTVGAVIGGQIGARISQRISTVWVARALAAGLLLVGLRLAYGGISTL
ncbi:MAG: sulfite exporter TauE/SafE family protein [Dehalococcoidia bacterium]|nr:sulfite exporter TauE/SafE family protein [Dehalococcoidia bacterium]